MYYAQINPENIAFAVTQTSGEIDQSYMIPLASFDNSVIGKRWADGEWEDVPQPPVPEVRRIFVGSFFDRFGPHKWPILADPAPMVQALVRDCQVRRYIDLDNPDLPAGLAMLVSAGHAIDPDAVINAPITEDERWTG
jgi:hypothetical protein